VDVFGPFVSETDARAYALDIADDNGWESVEPELLTIEEASGLATDRILWPYESEVQTNPDEPSEEEEQD
jgi:hypothetical protein